jgi:hypothetical protein
VTPEADLKRIAEDAAELAAEAAVTRMLERLGIDPKQPLEAQRDAAWVRTTRLGSSDPAAIADQQWVRTTRLASEKVGWAVKMTALGIVVTAVVGAVLSGTWAALKQAITGH